MYGPRDCEIDEEPDCGCQSIPGGMDPVVKNFVDVLGDAAERAIFDYDDFILDDNSSNVISGSYGEALYVTNTLTSEKLILKKFKYDFLYRVYCMSSGGLYKKWAYWTFVGVEPTEAQLLPL